MENDELMEMVQHGLISAVISVVATFAVGQAIPSGDLTWALYAVAFAGFFSSASSIYVKNQE